ncbi:MAG: diacylglycerol kinase family lipid kinase [Bacteroidetes bacterium]|nr:diacylglycerol kinase family lipid kinase [Bacteroidota bacterium]
MLNAVYIIINPNAGQGKGKLIGQELRFYLNKAGRSFEYNTTEYAGHGALLATEAVAKKFKYVLAAGGDGTVNEIAQALTASDSCLIIIPLGSGNGLARHLHLPFHVKDVVELITRGRIINCDTMRINQQFSINVSGIGFDAHVASLFGKNGKRGLFNYIKLVLSEYAQYGESGFQIKIGKQQIDRQAWMISAANSAQFGNEFKIAPAASVTDELIDLCIIRKPHIFGALMLAWDVYRSKVDKSSLVEIIKTAEAEVTCAKPIALHIDGEPAGEHLQFQIQIAPQKVKILVPKQTPAL